jgi:putative aminopeptidase FrvX
MEDCPLSQATANAAKLLREMISIPSYSGEEDAVSDLIAKKLDVSHAKKSSIFLQ